MVGHWFFNPVLKAFLSLFSITFWYLGIPSFFSITTGHTSSVQQKRGFSCWFIMQGFQRTIFDEGLTWFTMIAGHNSRKMQPSLFATGAVWFTVIIDNLQ